LHPVESSQDGCVRDLSLPAQALLNLYYRLIRALPEQVHYFSLKPAEHLLNPLGVGLESAECDLRHLHH
jgi:hypothetical protein